MFENIGRKIMTLAQVTSVLGIIASIIGAIVLWTQAGRSSYAAEGVLNSTAWAILIGGCLGSWIGSFVLYGFGQLIEDTATIAANSGRPDPADQAKNVSTGARSPRADDFSDLPKL